VFELIGQMVRLPFAAAAFLLEAAADAASGVGRLTDEGVGRALGRSAPAGGSAGSGRPPPAVSRFPSRPMERTAEGAASQPPGAAGADAEADDETKEEREMADTNLSDDSVKLVEYQIVSIERDRERILENDYKLVTDNFTSDAFTSWVIAHYFQSDHEPMEEKQKKYLRVCYRVICRWPRESLHYEQKQLDRLEGIEEAVWKLAGGKGDAESGAGGRVGRGSSASP